MSDDTTEVDLISLLIHVIKKFGPFNESTEELVEGLRAVDGEFRIAISQNEAGIVTIDVEETNES